VVEGVSRVLWVTSEAPDFTLGGGAMRQAHLIRGLAGVFDRVDLLVAGHLADPGVRALFGSVSELEVTAAPRRPSRTRRRIGDLWRTFGLRLPAEAHDRRRDRTALSAALSSMPAAYDVIHVEHLGLAGIVPDAVPGLRSLDIQNVPSRMAAQTLALEHGARQRFLRRGELAAARRFQAAALAGTDLVSVVSAEDAADLGVTEGDRHRLMVVPNGVDASRFPGSPLPGEPRLVFTGTLDFLPNAEGIAWFVSSVLPLVRAEVPGVTLDLVGRRPPVEVRALDSIDGVRVHADVAEVAPYLARARVAVVPVRIGSGSRLKVLEAMAAGRPVVSTSIGVEGLAVEFGRHVLVADQPEAMADAIASLCTADQRAMELGAAGRQMVEANYDWDRIASAYAAGVRARAAKP
jgi:polysaccharide biosynthesis protein PslH